MLHEIVKRNEYSLITQNNTPPKKKKKHLKFVLLYETINRQFSLPAQAVTKKYTCKKNNQQEQEC